MNCRASIIFFIVLPFMVMAPVGFAGTYYGQVLPWKTVQAPSLATGRISQLKVKPGDQVSPHEVLASIASNDLGTQDLKITSPCHCIVGQVKKTEGASVNQGEIVLELVSIDRLKTEICLLSEDRQKLKSINSLEIFKSRKESLPVEATVSYVSKISENDLYCFKAEIEIRCQQGNCREFSQYVGNIVKVKI